MTTQEQIKALQDQRAALVASATTPDAPFVGDLNDQIAEIDAQIMALLLLQ